MKNKKEPLFIVIIAWIYFWPILLPLWLISKNREIKESNNRSSLYAAVSSESRQQKSRITTTVDVPLVLAANHISTTHSRKHVADQGERAELDVDRALRRLDHQHYITFKDLIIPSFSNNLSLTQIDHVVVSTYGIFCIETKSTKGHIYGFSTNEYWKQYLGKQQYGLYSPYRQNSHHVRCLEIFLLNTLRAPIHSYIAFPNAKKVVVDGHTQDMSIEGVIEKINKHKQPIYDLPTVERIAKSLAYAASKRDVLRGKHINEVRGYIQKKVSYKHF